MSPSPPAAQRYQIIRELSRNPASGCITQLARDRHTNQQVAIAYFPSPNPSEHRPAYEREIAALRRLRHPGIPRYIAAFATHQGVYLIQEYKDAQSLDPQQPRSLPEVQFVALAVLEILAYLQTCEPPVIHRDLRPDNILMDNLLNVYLIGFSWARVGTGTGALSSAAAGTFGFMAPEQLYNRPLSLATDLYGLGATLICLLAQTPAQQIDRLIDEDGCLPVRTLLPELPPAFAAWLEQLIAQKPQDRFADAIAAQTALQNLSLAPAPRLEIDPPELTLSGRRLGDALQAELTLTNLEPATPVEGRWHVERAVGDRGTAWLRVEPARVTGDRCTYHVQAQTQSLLAECRYQRQLVLTSNASEQRLVVPVTVATGSLGLLPRQMLYQTLAAQAVVWLVAALAAIAELTAVVPRLHSWLQTSAGGPLVGLLLTVWLALATAGWLTLGYAFGRRRGLASLLVSGFISLVLVGVVGSLLRWRAAFQLAGQTAGSPDDPLGVPVLAAIAAIATGAWMLVGTLAGFLAQEYQHAEFKPSMARLLAILSAGLAFSVAACLNDWRAIALVVMFAPLLVFFFALALQKRQRQFVAYQRSTARRVQP